MTTTPSSPSPAICPVAHKEPQRFIDPDDELALPLHKRVVTQYTRNEAGITELRLFYDDKEISFDEPAQFGFGETLAKQSRFVARDATRWGDGLDWTTVRGMLGELMAEGILHYADEVQDEKAARSTEDGARPSPLPPATAKEPRSWDDCEAITREFAGRAIEAGYLELIVPVFRVAHMAMDADGRQVGEANVFPKPLRLDTPTNWRACIYPGTRYLDPKPMNVTALKAMRSQWGQMMNAVLRVRAAYLKRFPDAAKGWTVGHLERLSMVVLAVPTYALARRPTTVKDGKLHPALSSLFRVTDGVRMTMHQMLFIPIGEPTIKPDAAITGREILDYAERNYSFHSEFGVCAGPRAMMEEFIGVLVDGIPARNSEGLAFDPEVEAALADVEQAIDYGLLGLQAHAAIFSMWPIMSRSYERLSDIVRDWRKAVDNPPLATFASRLGVVMERLKTASYLGAEQWRVDRETVYADMDQQCSRGLGDDVATRSLTERLAPQRNPELLRVEQQLRPLLQEHFQCRSETEKQYAEQTLQCIVDFFSQAQALVNTACHTQTRINAMLGRAQPQRPFSANDIEVHILLQARETPHVPYLGDELKAVLGVDVMVMRDRIEVSSTVTGA